MYVIVRAEDLNWNIRYEFPLVQKVGFKCGPKTTKENLREV